MTRNRSRAFSLLELSVVLIVIGLITAAGINISSGVMQTAARVKTQERLATIQLTLDVYAKANGYLPCPSDPAMLPTNAQFGYEQRAGNICNVTGGIVSVGAFIGGLPTRTLGLPDSYAGDSWGNKLTYGVSTAHVGEVSNYAGNSSTLIVNVGGGFVKPAYVVVSHGPSGVGSYPFYGVTKSGCTAGTLDTENCDYSNATFTDATYNDGLVAAQFFDDYIIWGGSKNVVRGRLSWNDSAGGVLAAPQSGAAASGQCPTTANGTLERCESWCAQCKTNIGANGIGFGGFVAGTAVLCQKLITNTTPCEAVCVWAGKVSPAGPYLKCP